jgi:hypothetical protein
VFYETNSKFSLLKAQTIMTGAEGGLKHERDDVRVRYIWGRGTVDFSEFKKWVDQLLNGTLGFELQHSFNTQ